MNKLFLVGPIFLLFSLSVWASCNNPTISIALESDRTFVNGVFDVNLVFSANPGPSAVCPCVKDGDCGMDWQSDNNGSWERIPRNTGAVIDLNCSGQTCTTGRGYPVEDQVYKRTISCLDQNVYHIRGFQKFTNTSSPIMTVYCYPKATCVPPQTGNFDLDDTCVFQNIPVLVDQNYNILSNGHAIHNQSDVNFFSNGTKFVNIKDGGRIDLNHSMIFAGLNIPIEFGGPLIGGIFFAIVFAGLFYHRKPFEVIG